MLRRRDLRELQHELQLLGLSSLGSCEAHVLPSLDAVASALAALRPGASAAPAPPSRESFAAGARLLQRNAAEVLGPSPAAHAARIVVTSPPEAASDPAVLAGLVDGGTNILRINAAHDGAVNWARMVKHLRAAEAGSEHRVRIQFDLAGPKLRTGRIAPPADAAREWKRSAAVVLHSGAEAAADAPAGLRVPLAGGDKLLRSAEVGDVIRFKSDARGKACELRVAAVGAGWLAAGGQAGAAAPGVKLSLRRDDSSVAKAEVGADMAPMPGALLLSAGDCVRVSLGDALGAPPATPGADFQLSIALPAVFAAVRPGHRVFFDDGKFEGEVLSADADAFRARLTRVSGGTAKLAGEKGINLPDSHIRQPALDGDDLKDLAAMMPLGPDLIALSFCQTPADVLQLHGVLGESDVAVLLKIETAAAFALLPALLLAAMRRPRYGVMVARGDLAVEVGFARLSEVQEEMLWLCESAHAPVMWATQVLDTMARTGAPSRAEVTDAAMAGRSEAVMLNKGPFMNDVLALLRDVLARMTLHESKKMHLLRRLTVSGSAAKHREAQAKDAGPH